MMPISAAPLSTTSLARLERSVIVNSPLSTHGGEALDEGFVLADLPQHVLVVEEHADLGILRDGVDFAVDLGRFPEDRDHVAERPWVGGDEVGHVHGVAGLGELADPFMRGDIDVRALVRPKRP